MASLRVFIISSRIPFTFCGIIPRDHLAGSFTGYPSRVTQAGQTGKDSRQECLSEHERYERVCQTPEPTNSRLPRRSSQPTTIDSCQGIVVKSINKRLLKIGWLVGRILLFTACTVHLMKIIIPRIICFGSCSSRYAYYLSLFLASFKPLTTLRI